MEVMLLMIVKGAAVLEMFESAVLLEVLAG